MTYAGINNLNKAHSDKVKAAARKDKARAKAIAKRHAEIPPEEDDYVFKPRIMDSYERCSNPGDPHCECIHCWTYLNR